MILRLELDLAQKLFLLGHTGNDLAHQLRPLGEAACSRAACWASDPKFVLHLRPVQFQSLQPFERHAPRGGIKLAEELVFAGHGNHILRTLSPEVDAFTKPRSAIENPSRGGQPESMAGRSF